MENIEIVRERETYTPKINPRVALFFPKNLGEIVYENFKNFAQDEKEQKEGSFEFYENSTGFYLTLTNPRREIKNSSLNLVFKIPKTFNWNTLSYFTVYRYKPPALDKEEARDIEDFIKYFISLKIPDNEHSNYIVVGSKSGLEIEPIYLEDEKSYLYRIFGGAIIINKEDDNIVFQEMSVHLEAKKNCFVIEIRKLDQEEIKNKSQEWKNNCSKIIREVFGKEITF
jgi:hypothetical protein